MIDECTFEFPSENSTKKTTDQKSCYARNEHISPVYSIHFDVHLFLITARVANTKTKHAHAHYPELVHS